MKSSRQRIHHLVKKPDKTLANRITKNVSFAPQSDTSTINELPNADRLSPRDVIRLQSSQGNQSTMRRLAQRKAQEANKQPAESIQRLPNHLMGTMGSIFDVNLSDVSIHTDSHANQVTRTAHADAMTIGNDIYFQEGVYRPGTAAGNALVARELSHIQRAHMTGSPLASSISASSADKDDAQEVSGIVASMGTNPSDILRPANGPGGKPSKMQRRVLQRDGDKKGTSTDSNETSGMRTAGIVTSKVLQSIAGSVLGPVGLLWRGPLIQKKLGEIWGKNIGYRTGKADDRKRYGETAWGTVARWMASLSEILKEVTIWLGFGTFIAAIVSAATHGAATPVFFALGIATSVTAGLHALMRGLLAVFNGVRLYRTSKVIEGADPDKAKKAEAKLPFLKHQLVNDSMEFLGAAISSVLSGMGAGGLGSMGGDIAKDTGHSVAADSLGNAIDPVGRLVAFGAGTAANLPTGIANTTLNEGGKEVVKPSSKRKTGDLGQARNFWTGLKKDGKDMKTDYNEGMFGGSKDPAKREAGRLFGKKAKPTAQQSAAPIQDPLITELLKKSDDISNKGAENAGAQHTALLDSQKNSGKVNDLAPKIEAASGGAKTTATQLNDTGEKVANLDKSLPTLVETSVSGNKDEVKNLSAQVKAGLQKDPQSGDTAIVAQIDADNNNLEQDPSALQTKRSVQRKGGSGAVNWFATKLGGLKAGVARLNNKILMGVLKFAGKFNKNELDRQAVSTSLAEEKNFAADDVEAESENDLLFTDFENNANQLNESVHSLTEMGQ